MNGCTYVGNVIGERARKIQYVVNKEHLSGGTTLSVLLLFKFARYCKSLGRHCKTDLHNYRPTLSNGYK